MPVTIRSGATMRRSASAELLVGASCRDTNVNPTDEISAERVQEIYDDFAFGRLDRLSEVFDQDIDFISHAPTTFFPYLGKRHGRRNVLEALTELHEKLQVTSIRLMSVLVADDQAALTVLMDVTERRSSRKAQFLAAHFLRFRQGQIVSFCGIIDSLDVVRQLTAHRLDPFQGNS